MRPLAHGSLALVQAFVNTLDVESGVDTFAAAELAHAWLAEHGLLDGPDTPFEEEDRAVLVEVREALRALLQANGGAALDAGALCTLNRYAARAPLVVQFDGTGQAGLAPAMGRAKGVVAHLLGIVFAAMVAGTWQRLKACREPACAWAFFDASKNHSGAWCSMRVCGNRAKVRAYQRRRRAPAVA